MLALIGIILVFFAMILRLVHEHAPIQWWFIAIAVLLIGIDVLAGRGPRFWEWRRVP